MAESRVAVSPHEEKKSSTAIVVGILGFLVAKGGVLLKALKMLKYAKYMITAITMAISALLYGFAYGSWWFGLGLVLLIFVHEMGHVAAMARRGMPISAPVFIPFLGAAVFVPEFKDRDEEAYVGIGGPFIGSIGALLCIAAAFAFTPGSKPATLLHLLGYVGLFVNLFNLIPARPLDGGRILGATGHWVGYVGFPLLLALALLLQDIFFVFIALLSLEESPYRIRRYVDLVLWGCLFSVSALLWWWDLSGILSLILFWMFVVGAPLFFFVAWGNRHVPLPDLAPITEETLPLRLRVKWAILYSALLVGLFAAMVWHSQYLPHEVREHSMVRFVS